jgi:gliding motility-associated-like protein
VGKDTIVINDKKCPEGIYIPSAFTPGSAGNNTFKPLIHGSVQLYEFTVFNRYGQVVFISASPGKGWDGYYKGQRQNEGVFIWTCRYQFAGKQLYMQKGTVILLR